MPYDKDNEKEEHPYDKKFKKKGIKKEEMMDHMKGGAMK